MTDEPATTPAADDPDQGDIEAARLLVELARDAGQAVDPAVVAIANQSPAADRARALADVLIGQLREQRDEARRALGYCEDIALAIAAQRDQAIANLDAARTQAVAATTAADDLRARVEADLNRSAKWLLEEVVTDDGFAQSVGLLVVAGVRAAIAEYDDDQG